MRGKRIINSNKICVPLHTSPHASTKHCFAYQFNLIDYYCFQSSIKINDTA